jgi:hypothetical protein
VVLDLVHAIYDIVAHVDRVLFLVYLHDLGLLLNGRIRSRAEASLHVGTQ